jgi:uncharacterized protein (DUF433 family)
MSKLEDVEKLITDLNATERGQLLQWLLRMQGNISFGIEMNPKVNGGEPCILRTRIPVWLIIRARQLGTSDADLLKNYPTLRAEDISNASAYYFYHRKEIDRQIQENEEA